MRLQNGKNMKLHTSLLCFFFYVNIFANKVSALMHKILSLTQLLYVIISNIGENVFCEAQTQKWITALFYIIWSLMFTIHTYKKMNSKIALNNILYMPWPSLQLFIFCAHWWNWLLVYKFKIFCFNWAFRSHYSSSLMKPSHACLNEGRYVPLSVAKDRREESRVNTSTKRKR